MSKVVFSKTLSEPLVWMNTQLVTREAVEAVREMKTGETKRLRTIGSLALCRSLLKARFVDRFRVVVFPVITGSTGRERILRQLSRCCARHDQQPHLRRAHTTT